ncbi:hypothetical protein BKA70DRAFT_1215942 [Coprinopsis sp. MPI-PUGE-AT-0042]|nr:hypothetical protein BKA70DRAFT_1215942 [Coprinopsis sp. MPI-PUGE-AT-0042]
MPNDLDYVVQGLQTNQEVDNKEKLKVFSREATAFSDPVDNRYLMVWDGLLSLFKSKLFTDSRVNTSLIGGGRPGSSLSTVTKSGAIKDEQDTPMCQVRHPDGRLLWGGVGLMMGLGWSDRIWLAGLTDVLEPPICLWLGRRTGGCLVLLLRAVLPAQTDISSVGSNDSNVSMEVTSPT